MYGAFKPMKFSYNVFVGYMSLYERTATMYIGAKSPKHLPFR